MGIGSEGTEPESLKVKHKKIKKSNDESG